MSTLLSRLTTTPISSLLSTSNILSSQHTATNDKPKPAPTTTISSLSQDRVRRRVMKSVIANPYCSEAAAKDAMEAVWDVWCNDTKPFNRAP